MATSRRKQEERNLRVLREQGALEANRTCFDCRQRGTTYINMTIGSFVCTSCSGLLRGLNPPHRVKSISMASFTQEEIDLIKSRGNQYCSAVWLGLYDPKLTPFPDTKDEHKIRDFMITKYEKKRFYIDPSVALKIMPPNQDNSASSSAASTPGSDTASRGAAGAATQTTTTTTSSVSRPSVPASQFFV
ncbi:arf-GAP domain and FG repeat-containing protein 1-like [Scylla paramamosain]|uniref:arf-GAP domain and FG repeat-containing protein 1-like n=1 Tax=Scylla paramamosain TaxID=85552 RepID=UPI00308399DD